VPAHPGPIVSPSPGGSSADASPRPGDLIAGATFKSKAHDIVGYDPTADVIVAQPDSADELQGIDAHTGTVRWRHPLDSGAGFGTVLWSQSDLGAGSVLVNTFRRDTKAAELVALSTRTGEVRWKTTMTTRTEAMAAGPAILVGEPEPDAAAMMWANVVDPPTRSDKAGKRKKPSASPGPPSRGPAAKNGAATGTQDGRPSPAPVATPAPSGRGKARLAGRADELETKTGAIIAVAAGNGERLWTADLPDGCDLRAAAGDGATIAARLACGDTDRLELRDARTGELRSRTDLDPAGDDGGLGLLVRDGATLVRGARSFDVFAPDGRRLAHRDGDGCAEYCDVAVERGVVVVAQSGGITDRTDGVLQAFALADGAERWRADRTVRALVREGGRLYAIGPAPDPVPFLTVTGVAESGVSSAFATAVPADDQPQRGSAVLAEGAGGTLAWYRLRPVDEPAGYLGGAVQRPDPCAVLPYAELLKRFGKQPVTTTRAGEAECVYTPAKGEPVRLKVLWADDDEASAKARYEIIERPDLQRFGTVVVTITDAAEEP
jgi:outer membrane protein assembly factor BamB